MNLLIDMGNTRSKIVYLTDNQTDIKAEDIQAIDNAQLEFTYFERHWCKAKRVILASVNKAALTQTIKEWAKANNIVVEQVTTEASRHDVVCAYTTPSNLGIDRWLALIGARTLYPAQNIVVVDAGTATTVDLLSADGTHRGGWIVPGIDLMYQALMANTASINAVALETKNIGFGDDSPECVNHGLWAMTVGLIYQAITEAEKKAAVDKIVLCGGNGNALFDLLDNQHAVLIPALIFHGLKKYL